MSIEGYPGVYENFCEEVDELTLAELFYQIEDLKVKIDEKKDTVEQCRQHLVDKKFYNWEHQEPDYDAMDDR